MKLSSVLAMAMSSPSWGGTAVLSFQIAHHPPTVISAGTKSGAIIATCRPGWRTRSSSMTSSSVYPFALYSTATTNRDQDESEARLEEMQQQIEEISQSLEQAKKREDEARKNIDLLQEERAEVFSQTDMVISRLKKTLSEVMTDLSDQIEGAQDGLRKTVSQTRSEISNIQAEASEREGRLKAEILELELRLADLRREVKVAAKERDLLNKSMEKESRKVRAASRKEMEDAKSAAFREKKDLRNEKWSLETRIQTVDVDSLPSMNELEDEKRVSIPKISALKDALAEMKRKMFSQAEELKEQRAAKKMFFDQSLKSVKREKKGEIDIAKSLSERELTEEDLKLENATLFYESELKAKEKELQQSVKLTTEPVESARENAKSKAENDRIALYQEKWESISALKKDSAMTVQKVAESHVAIQDQYDAELENERWNLKREDELANQRLKKEDERRKGRRSQLQQEKGELATSLSSLMQDEKVAAEQDYENLTRTKTMELRGSNVQMKKVTNEIQTIRSNEIFVRGELSRLEDTSRQNEDVLTELEEERASFRKQVRRTMAVAIDRITRRGK